MTPISAIIATFWDNNATHSTRTGHASNSVLTKIYTEWNTFYTNIINHVGKVFSSSSYNTHCSLQNNTVGHVLQVLHEKKIVWEKNEYARAFVRWWEKEEMEVVRQKELRWLLTMVMYVVLATCSMLNNSTVAKRATLLKYELRKKLDLFKDLLRCLNLNLWWNKVSICGHFVSLKSTTSRSLTVLWLLRVTNCECSFFLANLVTAIQGYRFLLESAA